jgi:hypothetical protein
MRGTVVRKYETEWGGAVDLDISGTNQRGEVTCPGGATVLLPSRARGGVVLPYPEAEVRDLAQRRAPRGGGG